MPSSDVKQRLAEDVALWQADGLIDDATRRLLQERYDTPGFGLMTAVKYLGIAGGLLAAFGLLGLVVAMSGSQAFASVMLAGVAALFAWGGLRLARDPRARYVYTSQIILAIGVVAWAAAVGVGCNAAHMSEGGIAFVVGWGVVPLALVIAYRERNGFLLLLAVLALFHWVGSMSAMVGRSSYAFEVEDPRAMLPLAVAVLAFGIWHERRPGRFATVYKTVALIYANWSLIILSTDGYSQAHGKLWVAVFTLATLGQIVLGARLLSPLIMGFGVTCFAIDLFTRYFEYGWNRLDQALFFVLGGLLLMAFGAAFERAYRLWQQQQQQQPAGGSR